MATDLNSDPSFRSFGLHFDPFRMLGVDPSTADAGIDIAYNLARQKQAAPEQTLSDARSALKDQTIRLRAELAYPLDCPSAHLDSFYSDALASTDEALEIAARLPALTRTNFLVRSAVRLGASDKLLLALIDGHTAIDAMQIYQLLQTLRHQAGRPAPSLMGVRSGLDELLAAHGSAIAAGPDSTLALIDLVSGIKDSIEISRERPRLEVFSTFLKAFRAPAAEALEHAQSRIRIDCDELRSRANDVRQIERLAQDYRAWASLSEAVNRLELADQFPTRNDIVWEHLRGLLHFLVQAHQFEPARRIMDDVIEVLHPFATQQAEITSLARPFQQQIDWYRDAPNRTEAGRQDEPEARSSHRSALTATLALVAATVLGVSSAFWYFHRPAPVAVVEQKDTPMTRAEPESLPPASRGQRYSREFVRYCHFQEERLRVVKQNLQGQEDIRAYNALATDWNSRCADYFYQDEDLRAVKDEVIARQKQLEADAQRILSTWPWHASGGSAK
jgi:hypothetical protein